MDTKETEKDFDKATNRAASEFMALFQQLENLPADCILGLPFQERDSTSHSGEFIKGEWQAFCKLRTREFIQTAATALPDDQFRLALQWRLGWIRMFGSHLYYVGPLDDPARGAYHRGADLIVRRCCDAARWMLALDRSAVADCGIDAIHVANILLDIKLAQGLERIRNRAAFKVIDRTFDSLRNDARPGRRAALAHKQEKNARKIQKAMVVLSQHPDWTTKRIAEDVGCRPDTLSKHDQFRMTRDTIKKNTPKHKGYRDAKTDNLEVRDE